MVPTRRGKRQQWAISFPRGWRESRGSEAINVPLDAGFDAGLLPCDRRHELVAMDSRDRASVSRFFEQKSFISDSCFLDVHHHKLVFHRSPDDALRYWHTRRPAAGLFMSEFGQSID